MTYFRWMSPACRWWFYCQMREWKQSRVTRYVSSIREHLISLLMYACVWVPWCKLDVDDHKKQMYHEVAWEEVRGAHEVWKERVQLDFAPPSHPERRKVSNATCTQYLQKVLSLGTFAEPSATDVLVLCSLRSCSTLRIVGRSGTCRERHHRYVFSHLSRPR